MKSYNCENVSFSPVFILNAIPIKKAQLGGEGECVHSPVSTATVKCVRTVETSLKFFK